jgi:hypothetical protein
MKKDENQTVTSKRDALLAKLRERYPDQTFETDDDFSSRISDDYDEFDKKLGEYQSREKKISDLFNKDGMSAKFLEAWMADGDPRVQLIKAYGREGIDAAFEDPEVMDAMIAADREFQEHTAHEKDLVEQWEKNRAESYGTMEQVQQENGYTDEQMDEAMSFLFKIAQDVVMGKFTPEAIKAATHALNYDRDIADAEHIAEVKGRNEQIEEKLRKPKGDGMPQLAGGSAAPRKQYNLPGALGREKKSIYELGGMKRIPRKQ